MLRSAVLRDIDDAAPEMAGTRVTAGFRKALSLGASGAGAPVGLTGGAGRRQLREDN